LNFKMSAIVETASIFVVFAQAQARVI
jgi:hypothetical protein